MSSRLLAQKRINLFALLILFECTFFWLSPGLFASNETSFSSSPSLLHEFKNLQDTDEFKKITLIFENLDALFGKAYVKVQKLTKDNELEPEQIQTLFDFLSGAQKFSEIKKRIKEDIKWPNGNFDPKVFDEERPKTFFEALKILCKKKIITEKEAYEIQTINAPLKPEELTKLIVNGVVKTKKGY